MTGCDSSKDNDTKNPKFVKHGKDDAFTFNDGTKVVFYDVKSSATGKDPYHAITFTFTAPDKATATLSLSNFAAYVTAPMTCIGINASAQKPSDCTPTSVITTSTTIQANKSKPILAKFNYVEGTPTFRSHTTVSASSSKQMQTATKPISPICLPVSTLIFSDFRNCSLPAV